MDDASVPIINCAQYFSIMTTMLFAFEERWIVVISRRKRMGSVEAVWEDPVWNNLWCRSWW